MNNKTRVDNFTNILRFIDDDYNHEDDELIPALLTDLRHYCHRYSYLDFDAMLRESEVHFQFELAAEAKETK